MKIGIFGDTHGTIGVGKYNAIFKRFNLDLGIQCGDLYNYSLPRYEMYAVNGNHEIWNELEFRKWDKGLKVMKPWSTLDIDGVNFGFIGGIYRGGYNFEHRVSMGVEDWHYWQQVIDYQRPPDTLDYTFWVEHGQFDTFPQVIIAHDSPQPGGFNDPINPLREAVFDYAPKLYIHGHLHKFSDSYAGNTRIVSLPPCDEFKTNIKIAIFDTKNTRLTFEDIVLPTNEIMRYFNEDQKRDFR